MVGVNKHAKVNITSMGFWHIQWKCFLYITLKFFPITLFEHTHINVGIIRVINNPCIVSTFKVSKDMKHCIQMSFTR